VVLQLACKGPGTYPCQLTLTSAVDTRTVEVEILVTPEFGKATLEFLCSARQTIMQEIPLVNNSEKQITVNTKLSGSGFSGGSQTQVAARSTVMYPLLFTPVWMGKYTGELLMTIANSFEGNTYSLEGTAEEPLAEAHYVLQCRAQEQFAHSFKVPNLHKTEQTQYAVYSDLGFIAGPKTINVPAGMVSNIELQMMAQRSGVIHGSVSFVNPVNNHYVWFTLEIHADPPPLEEEISVEAEVRKAVLIHISMTNPVDQKQIFQVEVVGEGVMGLETLIVGPHETAKYDLIFSPLVFGQSEGSIHFCNDTLGEFWFKLNLKGKPAPPVDLPEMRCEVGTRVTAMIPIDNPTNEEVVMEAKSSNTRNFSLSPAALVLGPFERGEICCEYIPSSLHKVETGSVTVREESVGEYVFRVCGQGIPPTQMPPTPVSSALRVTAACAVPFTNPFPTALMLTVRVDTEEDEGVFVLNAKKTKGVQVEPFATLQVHLSFCPEVMRVHAATLVLEVENDNNNDNEDAASALAWRFPIEGFVDATTGTKTPVFVFTTAARTVLKVGCDASFSKMFSKMFPTFFSTLFRKLF
jgi:hypothetical protein